jgi:hypothetical protein
MVLVLREKVAVAVGRAVEHLLYRKSEPADIVKKLIASSLDFKEASK